MIKSSATRFYILLLTALFLSASFVSGQDRNQNRAREFCSNNNNNYNGDKVSFNELRESTVRPGNLLTVDGRANGGISVRGSDRSDVLVRACIQTWASSDEAARNLARNIRIETSPTVRAEGTPNESGWAVSYEVLVPRATNLKLTTLNGGIRISDVDGNINFQAQNGGVQLVDMAGDVRGRTGNGGVSVRLSGNSWRGRGLDVETTNGGVNLTMPENYAARVETGTVNGGFSSNIRGLQAEREERGWRTNRQVRAELNGGGAPIRVVTTNGGIRISSPNNSR